MDTLAIIKRIDVRLVEIGMTKSEFYEKSGISSASYSQWNSGLYNPSKRKIQRAAECLGVPFEYLWDEKSIKNPTPVSESGHSEKDPANVSIDGVRERVITRLCQLSPEDFALVDAFVQGLIAKHQGE